MPPRPISSFILYKYFQTFSSSNASQATDWVKSVVLFSWNLWRLRYSTVFVLLKFTIGFSPLTHSQKQQNHPHNYFSIDWLIFRELFSSNGILRSASLSDTMCSHCPMLLLLLLPMEYKHWKYNWKHALFSPHTPTERI